MSMPIRRTITLISALTVTALGGLFFATAALARPPDDELRPVSVCPAATSTVVNRGPSALILVLAAIAIVLATLIIRQVAGRLRTSLRRQWPAPLFVSDSATLAEV